MPGSAKGREYYTKLLLGSIDSATLETELADESNLTDFILMFSFSTVRSELLTNSSVLDIIKGSLTASNNLLYRHSYLAENNNNHIFRFDTLSPSLQPFFEIAQSLTVDNSTVDSNTLLSCLGSNTLFLSSVDGTNEDTYIYGLDFNTGSLYYTGAYINDIEDTGMTANTWDTHFGYIFGGANDTAETSNVKIFSFFSQVLYQLTSALQDQKKDISAFQNTYTSFLAGGFDDVGNRETVIETMSHLTRTFTVAGSSLSPGVSLAAGAESNTAGYVFGGSTGSASAQIQKIDMSTLTVSTPVSMVAADKSNTATRTHDQIFIFGGDTDTNKTYKYDTNMDTVAPVDQSITSYRCESGAEGF